MPYVPRQLGDINVAGRMQWTEGTLTGAMHIDPGGTLVVAGPEAKQVTGTIENNGSIEVAANTTLTLSGMPPFIPGGEIFNNGRLVLGDGSAIQGSGTLTNTMLLQCAGRATFGGVTVTNRGNLVVAGTLAVTGGATLDQDEDNGVLRLDGTITTDQGSVLELGGGAIVGNGTVDADLVNGGWLEPTAPGITITRSYTQLPTGSLALDPSAWTAGPLLTVQGYLALDGSLWALGDGETEPPLVPVALIQGGAAQPPGVPVGHFVRVVAPLDTQQLVLTYPGGGAIGGRVTGQLTTIAWFAGFDRGIFPTKPNPANPRNPFWDFSRMQQLYLNTPFAFVCIYLAPTASGWRVNTSWMRDGLGNAVLPQLQQQGWGAIALYFGEQSPGPPAWQTAYATFGGDLAPGAYGYQISALTAAGETMPSQVRRIQTYAIGLKSVALSWKPVVVAYAYRIYRTDPGGNATYLELSENILSYTDTGAQAFLPGVPTQVLPQLTLTAAQGESDAQEAARLAEQAGFAPGSVIYLDIESDTVPAPEWTTYATAWMDGLEQGFEYHAGVYCPQAAADVLAKLRPLAPIWLVSTQGQGSPVGANDQVRYPDPGAKPRTTAWQYYLDWPGALAYRDDSNSAQSWAAGGLDFDTSSFIDPSNPGAGAGQKLRRRVAELELSADSVGGGATLTATITLDGLAPAPDGTVVLLRVDDPHVTLPGTMTVPAGKSTLDVSILPARVDASTLAEVAARPLHVLSWAPPAGAAAPLEITP